MVLLLAALSLVLASCGGGSGKPTMDVVARIPWAQSERLEYTLKDSAGRETGRGVFTISVSGPQTELRQSYTSGSNSDETKVLVDSLTLKPLSATRVIQGSEDEEIAVTYTAEGATIKTGERQSGIGVPEHSYDNDSSLFLWRAIDFREGYEASYVTIISNRRSRQTVDLKVTGREQVTVAGGQFNVWRLEVKTSNAKQVAWFADTPARTLVKYDNGRGTIWELAKAP